MKKITLVLITSLFALAALSAAKPDAAKKECMKTAAIDGRKAMQECKRLKGPKRESCEKQTQASLAGAEKACSGGR